MSDTELVEELRNPGWSDCNHHLTMDAAADRIEVLTARIAELEAERIAAAFGEKIDRQITTPSKDQTDA
jgi:hypothetical protein